MRFGQTPFDLVTGKPGTETRSTGCPRTTEPDNDGLRRPLSPGLGRLRGRLLGRWGGRPGSVQAEHRQQRGVDLPLLVGADAADPLAESIRVDRAHVLNEDLGGLATDDNLGSERRRSSAGRGRREKHDRPRQQGVGLHDDAESSAPLLVPYASGEAQLIDVAALHGASGPELFHQLRNGTHLSPVSFVGFQRSDLGGQCASVSESIGGGDERGTDRFGATEAGRHQLSEGAHRLVVEPDRDRLRHGCIVSRFVVHQYPVRRARTAFGAVLYRVGLFATTKRASDLV